MPIQALYFGAVWKAVDFRYTWAGDGTLLLSLECESHHTPTLPLTYGDLLCHFRGMCSWQLDLKVIIGMEQELTEVLTLYHEFDYALHTGATLMLIVTPPDAYFERQAA
ncbi:MAG: hypothetical protein JOZ45_10125 [Acidobacteriaceae bacterium]|nr:hypothetical protein [Acidobacteriaceae bacterium]